MKKLLLLFTAIVLVSCSKECEYGGDQERVNELLAEIEQLEEEKDNASTESMANSYQKQIDEKKEVLGDEMAKCV